MRRSLILIPVILSALVLGAHVLRTGAPWLAVLIAALPLLLVVGRTWATRAVQLALALGTAEWVRTLLALVADRRALGQPYTRLAVILGVVALVTAASAVLLARWQRPASQALAATP
jgi:hypothetical protein